MATVQDQVKPGQAAKYDAFVEAQLARARGRIRTLDATTALLGFLAGTLAYGILMALCDRWFDLPSAFRQWAFAGYGVLALAYLAITLFRPLARRINPHYAAKQVEQAVPGAKNSVLNWLDLRDESLPPAIRSALVQRAAKDLGNVSRAIHRIISLRSVGRAVGRVAIRPSTAAAEGARCEQAGSLAKNACCGDDL